MSPWMQLSRRNIFITASYTLTTHQQHISNTLAAHQQHISNTLATHQQHSRRNIFITASYTLTTHQQHISNMLATHQQHVSSTLAAHQQHISNTLAPHIATQSDEHLHHGVIYLDSNRTFLILMSCRETPPCLPKLPKSCNKVMSASKVLQ